MEPGMVRLTQPFPEVAYVSGRSAPQIARPPITSTTSTPMTAKTLFCLGPRHPALGLVLAYLNAQCTRPRRRGPAGRPGPGSRLVAAQLRRRLLPAPPGVLRVRGAAVRSAEPVHEGRQVIHSP